MRNSLSLLLIILAANLHTAGITRGDGPAVQWEKTIGGIGSDYGISIQQTNDGGYIITGFSDSFGEPNRNVYLIKTDPNGDSLWQKTFGGIGNDYGYSVQQTTDSGFIITGFTDSFGDGDWDIYLIRTDPNGNCLWEKTFGGSNFDAAYSLQQTTDGGFIIVGATYSFGAEFGDVYLIKTDPNGNLIWQKTFGGSNDDKGYSVQQTTDGGFIIAGDTLSFGAGSMDVYLIKLTFALFVHDYAAVATASMKNSIIRAGTV